MNDLYTNILTALRDEDGQTIETLAARVNINTTIIAGALGYLCAHSKVRKDQWATEDSRGKKTSRYYLTEQSHDTEETPQGDHR